ncbi:unnamed protein product, partial [Rotaria magnacalcarata]
SNVLQDIDNRVNQLNEKLISNSSKFDQLMQKLYVKIDRLTSNINVHKHALEPYVDKTGETFPDVLSDQIDPIDLDRNFYEFKKQYLTSFDNR